MTRIDDVSTNDMNIKHLDTTKNIVITPRNEFGGQVQLNVDHTWTAKVSDGNNYVGDYPVTLESNSIVVNSADFTNLPAGYYHLEIWEEWTDSNGSKQRSIYPSPQRTIDFTIYQNVTDLAEKEIKTIGFQDVVDQAVMNIGMNYVFKVNTIEPDQTATVVQAAADGKNHVTFNIPRGYKGDKGDPGVPGDPGERGLPGNDGLTPHIDAKTGHWMLGSLDTGVTAKGDKGDTGTVDNAGLTNAPAFQALQAQVADIKANGGGRNLATGTDQAYTMWYGIPNTVWQDGYAYLKLPTNVINGGEILPQDPHSFYYNLTPGQEYTQTVWLETDATVKDLSASSITWFTSGVGQDIQSATLINLGENKYKLYSTYKWPGKSDNNVRLFDISNLNNAFDLSTGTYLKFGKLELEEGIVSHDWSPNPSEILTQSDYAKIKAAIVALGGSLS